MHSCIGHCVGSVRSAYFGRIISARSCVRRRQSGLSPVLVALVNRCWQGSASGEAMGLNSGPALPFKEHPVWTRSKRNSLRLWRSGVGGIFDVWLHERFMESENRLDYESGSSFDGRIRRVRHDRLAIHVEAVDLDIESPLDVGDGALGPHERVVFIGAYYIQALGGQKVAHDRSTLGGRSKALGILLRRQPLVV